MQEIQSALINRKPLHIVPQILELQETQAGKDLETLKSLIFTFKQKIEDLIAEVYQLNVEKQNDKEEHRIIVEKMEQDHQRYCQEIENYNTQIIRLEQAEKQQEACFADTIEKEKKNAEAIHMSEVATLMKKIEELQGQYLELKKYQDLQRELNEKIQKLKSTFIQSQYKHHDAMNQKEKLQKQQTIFAQVNNEVETKNAMKGAPKQAKTKVITQQKQALGQKMKLKQELFIMQKELDRLKKQTFQSSSKTKQTKITASINIESLEQYRAVGALQIAKIKAFKHKAEEIKNQISFLMEKHKKEISTIKGQGDSKVDHLSSVLKQIKKQKKQKDLQLQEMKVLASTILNQRRQLQQFFVEAINKLNSQASQKGLKQSQKSYGQKVDVTELDALDKEKIIKTLLARISLGGKNDIV